MFCNRPKNKEQKKPNNNKRRVELRLMSHARIHPKTVTIITIILFSLCILGITNRIWKTHKHKHTHTHEYIIQGKYNNRKDPKPKHIHNVWNLKCGKVVCFSHSENAAFWENAFFVILNKRRAQWIRIHHSSSHFWRSVLSLSLISMWEKLFYVA